MNCSNCGCEERRGPGKVGRPPRGRRAMKPGIVSGLCLACRRLAAEMVERAHGSGMPDRPEPLATSYKADGVEVSFGIVRTAGRVIRSRRNR